MKKPRWRFERSMFLALLSVALVPTALVVAAGTWALQDTLQRTGSAGPWEEVSASGEALAVEVRRSWPDSDPLPAGLQAAMAAHQETLESSVEMSRLFAAVSSRALARLPVLVAVLAALAVLLAWVASRLLASSFARPVADMVEWTGRIARDEPLPAPAGGGSIEELRVLDTALRRLSGEVTRGRQRAVEAARMATWTAAARRVAHEIKNPLTPMKMAARQLRSSTTTPADTESADVLLEEIERLDRMARTFVQVGAAPEGPAAPVDLVELTEELAGPLREGPVPVRVEAGAGLPLVSGHLDALRSAVRNLVVNAIEACEHGRMPDAPQTGVTITLASEDGMDGQAGVRLTVEDDGVGIPAGLEESVWNLEVTTKRRGSGIGLPIVRQTVLAHGGTVEAANRPDRGARFSMWIPSAPDDSDGETS